MYGLLALATLALAGLSEAARGQLLSKATAEHKLDGVLRSIKVDKTDVILTKSNGETITITDPELVDELHELSVSRSDELKMKRSAGFTRAAQMFKRDDGCDIACTGSDSGCEVASNCSCLKDCGPEGSECFSTCIPAN